MFLPDTLSTAIKGVREYQHLYEKQYFGHFQWHCSEEQTSGIQNEWQFEDVLHLPLTPPFSKYRYNINTEYHVKGSPTTEEAGVLAAHYRRLAAEQDYIVHTGDDGSALREALAKFPNLRVLEILLDRGLNAADSFRCQSLAMRFCQEMRPSMRVPWESRHFGPIESHDVSLDYGFSYRPFDQNRQEVLTRSLLKGIIEYHGSREESQNAGGELLQDPKEISRGQNLRRLTLGWIYFRHLDGMDSGVDGDANSDDKTLVPRIFGVLHCIHLTTVALYITVGHAYHDEDLRDCARSMAKGHIRRFLRKLPQLRQLGVKFDMDRRRDGDGDSVVYASQMSDIIEPGHVWRALETLSLAVIECRSGAALASAINRQPALLYVRLMCVCIRGMPQSKFQSSIRPGFRVLLDNTVWGPFWVETGGVTYLEYREPGGQWRSMTARRRSTREMGMGIAVWSSRNGLQTHGEQENTRIGRYLKSCCSWSIGGR